MKRKISGILFGLMFLLGFGILAYPTISDQWNTYRQSKLIGSYESTVSKLSEADFKQEWESARRFNDTMEQNRVYEDVFGASDKSDMDSDYWNVLNVAGDGIMGYLSIPGIHVRLAIYHGTAEEELQTGVGHLGGTKLPIGGSGTHCVLAAHRGLPSARLFTDIDQMERGDRFYIHVLDEILAYQVDAILPMVEKDDAKTLTEALRISEGEDYVTLFTCTPYGVNSHRLLVRGTRVPYEGEEEEKGLAETMLSSIRSYYMFYLLLGLSVALLAISILRILFLRRRKK